MGGLFAGIYRISEWIAKLMYANVMWLLCTAVGLVIFGFFPATSALFAVTRRWVTGEEDISVFQTCWHYFKADLLRANILGYLLTAVGAVLFMDFKFFQRMVHPLFGLISMIFIVLLFLYFVTVLYIFPIYVHYDFKIIEYIKQALIIAIGRPLQTLAMLVGAVSVYLFFSYFPVLIPFFGASLPSLVLMRLAYFSFQKTH